MGYYTCFYKWRIYSKISAENDFKCWLVPGNKNYKEIEVTLEMEMQVFGVGAPAFMFENFFSQHNVYVFHSVAKVKTLELALMK